MAHFTQSDLPFYYKALSPLLQALSIQYLLPGRSDLEDWCEVFHTVLTLTGRPVFGWKFMGNV